jgi:catechol 2,3-dioxygenase-like lactoylglutathione lyase family enzyme
MITGMRTVGIPVADQDRALDFYVGTLGLDKRLDRPVPRLGGRWIEIAVPGSTTTIALVRATATGVQTGIRLTTPDAAALHEDLTARGVEVGELLRWGDGVPPMFGWSIPDRGPSAGP